MTIDDLTIDNLIQFLDRSFKVVEDTKNLPADIKIDIVGIDIRKQFGSVVTRFRCYDGDLNEFFVDAYETVGLIGTSLKEIVI